VAIRYVSKSGVQPDAEAVSTLLNLARGDPNDTQRFMALHVLNLATVGGLDSWLRELAEGDQSAAIRREANIALMRKGSRAAKNALLADLRQHPNNFGVADELWQHRRALKVTAAEERELREAVLRYVEWLRGRLHDPDENESTRDMAIAMLGTFVRDGCPHQEEDADAVGKFAASATEVSYRIRAIETLAAFGTPRARTWLQDLASSRNAKRVVDHARKMLQESLRRRRELRRRQPHPRGR
jgi:hypothetical protein